MSNNSDFYHNPGKKQRITFTAFYVVSLVLIVLSVTDVFKTELFSGTNATWLFLMALSTYSIIRLYVNYFKRKKEDQESES